ncbi:MAG: glycosyltransferase family 4 protein [Prevotella sp.]|nr:glycosyltransferase family 4 protein [Prevotella sp.]
MNKKVFAILAEPASYTIDRNANVYDKLDIKYCYIHSSSLAKSEFEQDIEPLDKLTDKELSTFLSKVLKENDIIILNGTRTRVGLILLRLNKKFRRVIGLDSDGQLNIPFNPIKRIVKYMFYHNLYRKTYIYGLAGGSFTHKDAFRHYGMPEERIFLSPMMVNNGKFAYHQTRGGNKFTFLYVGRIVAVKNIELMIKAFLMKFRDNGNVELRIVGTGDLLVKLREEYDFNKNVLFEGAKYGNNLIEAYRAANVFVLPSSFEPWGLVVNEAMCAGMPVIVSNQVGAAWDLVKDRNTGFIFQYNDAMELACRMAEIYENKQLYSKYSENAYDTMMNYWNYDLYRTNLESFINSAQ